VLDTLQYIHHQTPAWLEITTLLIPGKNDSDGEISAMVDWIGNRLDDRVPLHFTAFHPDWKMRDLPRTPHETLLRARRIALQRGLRHVYVGNVHDVPASSTCCANCGTVVISRDWHRITGWQLDPGGNCTQCGHPVDGHFAGAPGISVARPYRIDIMASAG
jgi:pyruvate formate lyase activating enzyme